MHKFLIFGSFLAFVVWATPAVSQSGPACNARYDFDGSLADVSGSGFDGQMIGKEGVPATPNFVEGRSGQALAFDGNSAMRAFLDLNREFCPQVTIAAWIKVTSNERRGSQSIVSTGHGTGPGILSSTNNLNLRGPANGLLQRDVVRPFAGWMFIAGVYDYTNLSYRLHWRNRNIEGTLREDGKRPQDAFWVGAFNDRLSSAATDIVIDDLQIIGRALTVEEIRQLQATDTIQETVQGRSTSDSSSCLTSADCGSGSYCAVDNTCHPESHLPKAASSSGGFSFGAGTIPEDAGGVAAIERSVDDYAPSAPPVSISQQEQPDSAELIEQSVEGNQVYNRFDPDAPLEDGPPEDESVGMLVGDALRAPIQNLEAHGDVRDCTSFAEVASGVATNLRDAVVSTASTLACPFLATPVAASAAAINAGTEVVVGDPVFQEDLLLETIDKCKDIADGFGTLPDKALSFWNNNINSGGWSTIGPRGFLFGNKVNGNLVSPGDRKFISMLPVLFQDNVHLTLKELDGKARVTARICSISMTNRYTLLRTFSVNEAPGERENQSQRIDWALNDVRGDFITVILDASGLLGKNFKYEMMVE